MTQQPNECMIKHLQAVSVNKNKTKTLFITDCITREVCHMPVVVIHFVPFFVILQIDDVMHKEINAILWYMKLYSYNYASITFHSNSI